VIWVGLIIRKEGTKNVYKTLVGNRCKKSLGRPRLKGEDVIKADVKENLHFSDKFGSY